MPAYKTVQADITVQASPDYSDGDTIGSLFSVAGALQLGRAARIVNVVITDGDGQNPGLDVIVFDGNPSASTFTDNAAVTITDADMEKICCVVSATTSEYKTYTSNGVVDKTADKVIHSASTETLYFAVVARQTINFATTTALNVKIGLELGE